MTERMKDEETPVSGLRILLDFGVWLMEAAVAGVFTGLACAAVVAYIWTLGA